MDFISKMLVYPPKERLKPVEGLLHPYFDDIRKEGFVIPNVQLPDMFDFTKGSYKYLINYRGIISITRVIKQISSCLEEGKKTKVNFYYFITKFLRMFQ